MAQSCTVPSLGHRGHANNDCLANEGFGVHRFAPRAYLGTVRGVCRVMRHALAQHALAIATLAPRVLSRARWRQ
eukprot:687936-Alexandrium_andersonii.AAC.1